MSGVVRGNYSVSLSASFGLLAVIWGVPGAGVRSAFRRWRIYYFGLLFTASTSFANPAVTMARSLTSTFSAFVLRRTGIVCMQFLGALAATAVFAWLTPASPQHLTQLFTAEATDDQGTFAR